MAAILALSAARFATAAWTPIAYVPDSTDIEAPVETPSGVGDLHAILT